MKPAPFVAALDAALDEAAPVVRAHLAMADGPCRFVGEVVPTHSSTGWIGGLLARLVSVGGIPTDKPVRFVLENRLFAAPGNGATVMRWRRTLHAEAWELEGNGWMTWDAARKVLVDAVGPGGLVEVDLVPTVEASAVCLTARRQGIRFLGLRLPLPRWLVGTARTREWEEPDGSLGLSLTLEHWWLGAYGGYRARLTRKDVS